MKNNKINYISTGLTLSDEIEKIQEIKSDQTTIIRYQKRFHKNEIRHYFCSLDMSDELKNDIESQVKDWLNSTGLESHQLEFDLGNNLYRMCRHLVFEKSEISFRICDNNWIIYHIAYDAFWPNLISSRPKLMIQKDPANVKMMNEILSCNFSDKESSMCSEAIEIQKKLDDDKTNGNEL